MVESQQLLRRVVEAQEECRHRIARDLHDEVSQSLTTALVQVDTVEALLRMQAPETATQLDRLRSTLLHLHEEVQRVLLDLRPVLLEQKGLMSALGWYATERLRPLGVATHLSGGRCAPDLPQAVTLTLYRIGQEALANVARHAVATNVWIDLRCTGTELVLTVRDDGRGFDAGQNGNSAKPLQGVGLLGMQERALLVGGAVSIQAASGQGVTIEVSIPYVGACCTP